MTSVQQEFHYQAGSEAVTVTVEPDGERLRVRIGEQVFAVAATPGAGSHLDLEVDGRRLRAYAVSDGARQHVALDGHVWTLQKADPRRRARRQDEALDAGSLRAAMPGRVLDVLVAVGDEVKKGETLVLLEAMKMELRIQAPRDGRVARVGCQAGQVVEKGQLLVGL
jgi:biotin carboxyl carrier protein